MTLLMIAGLACVAAVLAIILARIKRAHRKVRRHKLNLLEDLGARVIKRNDL